MKKISSIVLFISVIFALLSALFGAWQGYMYGPHEDCIRVNFNVGSGKWFRTVSSFIAVPLNELESVLKDSTLRSALQTFIGEDEKYGYFRLHNKCLRSGYRGYPGVNEWKGQVIPNPKFALPDQTSVPQLPQYPQFPLYVIAGVGIVGITILFRRKMATARR